MPEPNLPTLKLNYDPEEKEGTGNLINVAKIRKKLKPHPDVMRRNLVRTFEMRLETAIIIVV